MTTHEHIYSASIKTHPILKDSIRSLNLSRRTAGALLTSGIDYIHQLVNKSEGRLLRVTGFGRVCLKEVKEVLQGHGLNLGIYKIDLTDTDVGEIQKSNTMNTPQTPNLWDEYAMRILSGLVTRNTGIPLQSYINDTCALTDAMLKESQKRRDAE